MNDWLPRVADLVDAMIDYWKNLVPMKSKDGGRGAILFRCIHALMSLQVQKLIKRSLDHLYSALNVYKVCRPQTQSISISLLSIYNSEMSAMF